MIAAGPVKPSGWQPAEAEITTGNNGDDLGHRDVGQTERIKALAKRDDARTNLAQPPTTEQTSNTEVTLTH